MSKEDIVQMFRRRCRHPFRPRASQIINGLFPDFTPFESAVGPSLITGKCVFQDKILYIIAQQKPTSDDLKSVMDLKRCNLGMLTTDEHSKILSVLDQAKKSQDVKNTYIFTIIDTYGADISMYSAERFQAFFIATLIREFLTIPIRTISLIIGEGGSGGAVAIQGTDIRGQMDDALFATANPEGTASIIFRDTTRIKDALTVLRPTAKEVKAQDIIDRIVPTPEDVTDVQKTVDSVSSFLAKAIKDLNRSRIPKLIKKREIRAKKFGLQRGTGTFYDIRRYIEKPIKDAFRKPPPNIEIVNYSMLSQVGDEYQDINPKLSGERFVKCGVGKSGDSQGVGCGKLVPLKELLDNFNTCPECGFSYPLDATGWIDCLADSGSFHEMYRDLTVEQLLDDDSMTNYYKDFLSKQEGRSHFKESLVVGSARLCSIQVAMAISAFYYSGGSMGVVFGEKFRRAVDFAIQENIPFISVCCSGGARLYEGTLALMQMIKTIESVNRLKRHGLPFISILADPSTGGAIASYAALGDIVIAEPEALVAFAGPRVIKDKGFDVDEKLVRSNHLHKISLAVYSNLEYFHGIRGIQEISSRKHMAATVAKYLDFYFKISPKSGRLISREK